MRILILLFMVSGMFNALAQTENMPYQHSLCDVPLIFNQDSFGERFSVRVIREEEYDYYVIDLTKLTGRFERVCFLNLTYQAEEVVNIDPNIDGRQMWFKTQRERQEQDINRLFDKMKEASLNFSRTMSIDEQAAWLSKFDKFKNIEIDE